MLSIPDMVRMLAVMVMLLDTVAARIDRRIRAMSAAISSGDMALGHRCARAIGVTDSVNLRWVHSAGVKCGVWQAHSQTLHVFIGYGARSAACVIFFEGFVICVSFVAGLCPKSVVVVIFHASILTLLVCHNVYSLYVS